MHKESTTTVNPRNSKRIHRFILAVVIGFACALPSHSQSSATTATSTESKPQVDKDATQASHPSSVDSTAEIPSKATAEALRKAQIEADTKELYQLSAELREEVAKTYKESLSLTVLKKAEEVEKLARSLKALMNQEAAAARK
jgi:hypothetical protein